MELNFTFDEALKLANDGYNIMLAATLLYFPVIIFLSYLGIKKNDRYDTFHSFWNLIMFLFSFWGFYYTGPPIYNAIASKGLVDALIDREPIMTNLIIYGVVFMFSKVFELFETPLILVRGRPLIFLHYFHHFATMVFTWRMVMVTSYLYSAPLLFCSINFFVHTIMYLWYFVSSLGHRTSSLTKNIITIMQTVQMFIGVGIIGITECYGKWHKYDLIGFLFGLSMYTFYIYLFGKLTYDKVFRGQKPREVHRKSVEDVSEEISEEQ